MTDELSARIAALSPAQYARLAERLETTGLSPIEQGIPRRTGAEVPPLSFSQQRLWFLDQLEPGGHAYNLAKALRLRGRLQAQALQASLDDIVRRHEVLRTTFASVDGQPVQMIAPALSVPLPVISLEHVAGEQRETEARRRLTEWSRTPFDLAHGPLFRAHLVRLAPEDHLLLLTMHHIVTDGWSIGVLMRELATLYGCHLESRPPALQPLPIQYADYAVWQREHLRGELLATELAYWREQLQGVPDVIELPIDHPRPGSRTYAGAKQVTTLPASLVEQAHALSREQGTTLFMVLLASLQALLARYSGQTDIVVGSPIAGRSQTGTEGLIGFFVNSLAFRTDLSGDPSFRELLRRVREVALQAYDHQQVPFEKLVEELQPARSLGHAPLFQVMLALQNVPRGAYQLAGLEASAVPLESGTAKYDLTMFAREEDRGLQLTLQYSTELFEAGTAARLLEHYRLLLEGALRDPDRAISGLTLLTGSERAELEAEWGARAGPAATGGSVVELFAEQAGRRPGAIAVAGAGGELTYGELQRRAAALAARLRARGVGPEVPVGVYLERSPDLLVALLGILQAGGAYLPLDPGHPAARLEFILGDAAPPVLVSERRLRERLPAYPGTWVWVDEAAAAAEPALPRPAPQLGAEHLAYVIYTSGSTGRPKGVQISHGSLVNLLRSMREVPGIGPADRLLAVTTPAFDIAALELFLPLTVGARVVIAPAEMAADGRLLAELLAGSGATLMQATPATWRMLVEVGWTGSPGLTALCGGEALPEPLAEQLLARGAALWNLYGPTETTIWSAVAPVAAGGPVRLGAPIAGTRLYLLDRHLQLVPTGVPGELYIAGAGLARGYLRRPGLTGERFLPDPFGGPGARMYRTGDLVRRRADGGLEFLGRQDQQVKIRGFRVEPGEIEAVLGGHPGLRQAAVGTATDATGAPCLVAYVVPAAGGLPPPLAELRAHLGRELPEYMIPSALVPLDRLPLTPAGKLDRAALPATAAARLQPGPAFVAPRTPLEDTIAGIWAAALKLGRVGVHDNFFELGGHSLLATRVVARIREALHHALPLRALFEAPTVAGLAGIVARGRSEGGGLVTAETLEDLERLSDEEAERLLADTRATEGSSVSDIPQEDLARRLAGLSPAKRALLELRLSRQQPRPADPGLTPIPRRVQRETAPLSFAQLRLWFLDQLQPETGLYNMASRIRLQGVLHPETLQRAIEALVARHESLRTTFPVLDGEPFQSIAKHMPVELPIVELAPVAEAEREDAARRLAAEEARHPFDLARGPLFRTRLLRLGPQEHVLLVTLHHIISDAWSMGVLFSELGTLYEGLAAGSPVALPEPALHYADFAAWQREWLQGEVLETQLAYWREQFRTEAPPLPLAPGGARPEQRRHAGGRIKFTLPPDLVHRLEALGREEGATLFMTMLAAYKVLLCRYTGREDIVVGSPIAGRTRTELEGLIGFFVNTLALRSDLGGDPDFRELLRRVRQVSLGAYAHQDVPFERLVQELQPERDLDRNPLFQAVFSLQNAPRSGLQIPGLVLGLMEVEREQSKFDLILSLTQRPDGMRGSFIYSTALFDEEAVARMAAHYETLLHGVVARPHLRLSRLPLLTEADCRDLATDRNATGRAYPPPNLLHELFEQHAARTPDAIAASDGGRELTYGELNRAANRLADRLREVAIGPERRVGLCVGSSLELLVGMLGTLKAGGAYVPLDPTFPRDRLAFMMADAGVEVLLLGPGGLERELLEPLPQAVRQVVQLGLDYPEHGSLRDTNFDSGVSPDNLAYVMYTSGSTGAPKGVAAHHRAVTNFVRGAAEEYGLTAVDRVLHLSSISSDISTDEIFPAWSSGAAVVLGGPRPWPGADFLELLRRRRVSVVSLPTAFWHAWVQELQAAREPLPPDLRLVIVGGEQAQATLFARWRELDSRPVRFLNTYGPTETTVQATLHEPASAAGAGESPDQIPIGRPVPNVRVYVLDRHLNLVPAGMVGELCIGGAGVARGYLGRPELTAERFVPDPFGAERGGRLYRTGDRVRFRRDGELEFLGRTDHQVKIRGYRIELGEIEAVLSRHPGVGECVVVVRETEPGERRLAAYVVPSAPGLGPETGDLAAYLAERLPAYMLPSDYVRLAALPVTPTNKVDRDALPAPGGARPELPSTYVGPRTPLEEAIAGIWATVLKLDRVGVHDNFFSLGGHSLVATQVVSRIRAASGTDLPLRALFEAPTVAGIAERVQALNESATPKAPPLVRLPRERHRVASPGGGDLPRRFPMEEG